MEELGRLRRQELYFEKTEGGRGKKERQLVVVWRKTVVDCGQSVSSRAGRRVRVCVVWEASLRYQRPLSVSPNGPACADEGHSTVPGGNSTSHVGKRLSGGRCRLRQGLPGTSRQRSASSLKATWCRRSRRASTTVGSRGGPAVRCRQRIPLMTPEKIRLSSPFFFFYRYHVSKTVIIYCFVLFFFLFLTVPPCQCSLCESCPGHLRER